MIFLFLFSSLLCLLILIIILHFLNTFLQYYSPSQLIQSFLQYFVQSFHFEFITWSPFHIQNFELITYPNTSLPQITLTMTSFQIITSFSDWLNFQFNQKFIQMKIVNMKIFSPDMSLEFIMDPPDKPKTKSSLSIIHRLSTIFEIDIEGILIEFYFPKISTRTIASAGSMKLITSLSQEDTQGLIASIEFLSNLVEIYESDVLAVQYVGENAKIEVDVNIPTMMMNVLMKMNSQDITTVHMQHFLTFFNEFQNAEDNSIELKMAYGYPTGGKMKKLQVFMNNMLVFLKDTRSPVLLIMAMEDIQIELRTTRTSEPLLNNSSYRWIDPSESCNLEKVISIQISFINFLGNENCNMKYIKAIIIKKVDNTSLNYIDAETVDASIDTLNFQYISDIFLNWLLILQNISDNIPSSRFGHMKTGHIHAIIHHINASIAPQDDMNSDDLRDRLHQDCIPPDTSTSMMMNTWNPVSHLFDQNINRKFIRFIFTSLDVTKFEDPETLPPTNDAVMTFRLLDIVTNMRYSNLSDDYYVEVDENKGHMNLSVIYEIIDGQAKFSLGDEFQLHTVYIREVMIIEKTYSTQFPSNLNEINTLDPLTSPITNILSQSHPSTSSTSTRTSRIFKLFHIESMEIDAVPESMTVTSEQMKGYIGFISIIKCLATVDIIMKTQKRITGKMDKMKENSLHADTSATTTSATSDKQPNTADTSVSLGDENQEDSNEKRIIVIFKSVSMDLSLSTTPTSSSSIPTSNSRPSHLFLKLYFEELKNIDHGNYSKLEWNRMVIYANNELEHEFMIMTRFELTKDIQWRKIPLALVQPTTSTSSSSSHPSSSTSTSSLSYPPGTRNHKRCLNITKLAIDDIEIKFSPSMNLSLTLDQLLIQKDCYNYATSKKKKMNTTPTVGGGGGVEETVHHTTLLDVDITRFTLKVDAYYNENLFASFAELLWKKFIIKIENDLNDVEIQRKIHHMDTNSLRVMNYTGITGGRSQISWEEASLMFTLMNKPYVYADMIHLEGDLFLASVSDERIIIKKTMIGLSDLPAASSSSSDTPTTSSTSVSTSMEDEFLILVRSEVSDSPAPSKVYSNCTMTINDLELYMDVETDSIMSSFLAAIDQAIPPNKDIISPPLQWWDSIRYWTHGSVIFIINKLTYSISRKTYQGPLKLDIIIHQIYLSINRSLLELEGSNYLINATYQEYQGHNHSIRRRENITKKFQRQTSSTSISTSGNKIKNNQITIWKICSIPSLSLSLAHTTSSNTNFLYDHHDIYLSPAHVYYKDRFYYFRMNKNCSIWAIHMTCSDTLNNCMMLSLKLDVIQRITSAFTSPSPTTTTDDINTSKPSSTSTRNPTSKNISEEPSRRSSTIHTIIPMNSLPDCISSLDIHLTMDNLLACSWPNSSNLHGIVFFQDLMKLDIRLINPTINSTLQLESIHGHIENIDVYVREWKILNSSSPSTSTSSSNVGGMQCLDVDDIIGLFEPIYKLAHASKVILKYEEEDIQEVLTSTSTSTSINYDKNMKRRFSTRTSHAGYSHHRTSISSITSVTLRDKLVYNPSILSFRANHSAFMPPSTSLPKTFANKRTSTHALDLLTNFSSLLSSSRHFSSTTTTSGTTSASTTTNIHSPSDGLVSVNKMWDLKIVDIRLLWTISLRDMIANYAAKCSDIFKPPPPPPPSSSSSKKDQLRRPSIDIDNLSHSHELLSRSVSMDESILPSRVNSSILLTPKGDSTPNRIRGSEISSSSLGEGEGVGGDPDDDESDQMLVINLPTNMRNRAMTKRHSGEIDLATYYLTSSSSPQRDLFSTGSLSPGDHNFSSSSPISTALTTAQSKRKRRGNRRLSLRDKNLNVDESLSLELQDDPSTCDSPNSFSKLPPTPPKPILLSGRLLNRSSSLDNSLLLSSTTATTSTSSKFLSPATGTSTGGGSTSRNHQYEEELTKNVLRNQYLNFFSIELQDPQVNILDEKTQSTLLIVIDGSSTLLGKKHNGATVTVQGLGHEQEKESPKRKVNVRLKMENVNAYTITTSTETVTNIVNWKALDHTDIGNQQRLKHLQRHKRSSTNEKFVTTNQSIKVTSQGDRPFSNNNTSTSTSSTSTLLRNAIQNFEMIAVYTYYEDLTEEEASKLYLHRTREELMNSFMLDLPQVCLKVDSLQFSILLNTIRNVLLAPPPAQTEGSITIEEDNNDLSEKRGILQLEYADGLIPSLDNRVGRTHIKNIVESNSLSLPETEFCTAQSIEYFIGRGTWQMCAPNSEDVMLEVGFMGLFGSHSFHEDRSSSTIFEVQRFWVRDTLFPSAAATAASSGAGAAGAVGHDTKKNQQKKMKIDDNNRTGWVLMPVLAKEGTCKRCKEKFDVTKDSASSCCCHVDSEGVDGQYREMLIPDPFYGGFKLQKCWSCCKQTDINAPGCLTRPHICKELMLSIRAESGIPASIADIIDITIFQTLEISVFPGCEYCIHVEISSQVLEMLHSYFAISDATMIDEDDMIGDGNGGIMDDTTTKPNGRNISIDNDRKTSKDDDLRSGLTRGQSYVENSNDSNVSPTSRFVRQTSDEIPSTPPPPTTTTLTTTGNENTTTVPPSTGIIKQEALFIKYLRVGHIAVEVNTVGFAFNLEKYKAIVNEFSLRNKVLDWHRLIWKFEMHIALCMTSHTATSSMNKLWTIMFGKSNENDQSKGVNRYHDDDTTSKKILLLGE